MVDWNNPKSLGRAIAEMRVSIGEFASRAGLSRSQIYRLINGEFRPQFETQRRIEAVLMGKRAPRSRRKSSAPVAEQKAA